MSGGAWRDRSHRDLWPAPPPRRGPHPLVRTAGSVLRVVLVAAALALAAGGAVWVLEDQEGRDDIQRSLHELPVVGRVVADPDAP